MGNDNFKVQEPWIDVVKWIACMLVLIGHFFQSMVKSSIMDATALYEWFNHTIYLFHVSLFFICSGYLYQKHSVVNDIQQWYCNMKRKLFTLGIPYITFSGISYLMKEVFQSAVNTKNDENFLTVLLLEPMSPYWYLYSLFFLFVVTPTLKNKQQALWMTMIAVILFFLQQNQIIKESYPIQGIAHWEIWFLFGMLLASYRAKLDNIGKYGIIGLLLIPMSIWGYNKEMAVINQLVYNLIGGMLGCILVIFVALFIQEKISEKWLEFSRNNTLPIFLMHTIFAAGIRSVLLKVGITNLFAHVILGISVSIVLPIIAAEIMRRSKWLYFFIQPNNLFKVKKI